MRTAVAEKKVASEVCREGTEIVVVEVVLAAATTAVQVIVRRMIRPK